MARALTFLPFPNPPEDYTQDYMAQVTRTFSVFQEQINTPGESRATKLTFTALPSGSDKDLETGALFEVDGFVKISKVDRPHCASNSATSTVGSVTVTIG